MKNKKTKSKILRSIIKKVIPILKRNGVVKAGIFGSFARGEQEKNSDVDILVKFKKRKDLFDISRLELELENNLKKKVDLLTYNSVHPLLKKIILKEEVKIL